MPTVQDFFSTSINLDSTPNVAAKFSLPLLLVDHVDVPIYERVTSVTPATYTTKLTASTEARNWFTKFYGQTYPTNPINTRKNITGYVGRWVSAASKYHLIFPDASSTFSVWVTVAAAGKFEIDDGTNQEDISPDFTGDTDMDDVAASITAAFAASTNFTGYTCTIDSFDNLVMWGSATGSSAVSFSVGTPASGTDLTAAAYLSDATSFAQAGLDAETLGAAATAVFAVDNTPSIVFQRGGTDVQKLAFLTSMDAISGKFTCVTSSDTDHETGQTTTLGYLANGLDFSKCHVIYTRQDDYIDAAAYGENLPQDEGSVDYALNPLTSVSASGLKADGVTVDELSDAAVSYLDAINCDFVTTPLTETHLARGLCPNGDEVRIVIGKLWCEYNVDLEGYQYLLAQSVNTFTDPWLGGIKGIIEKYLDACVERKCIEAGYTLTMPKAADFTAAQKASHTATLSDVLSAGIQFAVNQVFVTGTWSAQ